MSFDNTFHAYVSPYSDMKPAVYRNEGPEPGMYLVDECRRDDKTKENSVPFMLDQTSLKSDPCWKDARNEISQYPGTYITSEFATRRSDEDFRKAGAIVEKGRTNPLRVAFAAGGGEIDADSDLRQNKSLLTHHRTVQPLSSLPINPPLRVYGVKDLVREQIVVEGKRTHEKRTEKINPIEKTADLYFYPLLPYSKEVQDPEHIISTDVIRGGYPSRRWMKDRCKT